MEDTIAAISTALGVGAISIIRVSGSEAISNVNKIYRGKDLSTVPSHNIVYGHIVDNNIIIDEVLVSIFKAPKTFTREDVVEINSHGGIATTNRVLELLLENGCRLAEPGEFTKRAYLNGRIDLLEAEGVMDLINAKTESSRKMAISQLNGNLSNNIKKLRQEIVEVLANIEVNIDYPEYDDIKVYTIEDLSNKLDEIENQVNNLLKQSENGKIIKNGINVAILGRPNVGKSSLLNSLIEEDKAIVTNIEGTTRDLVEGSINLDGILLNVIDTAGIRKTDDVVEKIGVNKSLDLIDNVDLIIYMLNNNEKINNEDKDLLDRITTKKHIIVINKCDLNKEIDLDMLEDYILISVNENKGITDLKNRIKQLFNIDQITTSDYTYLSNARTIAIMKNIKKEVLDVRNGIKNDLPIDMVEIDVKRIWELLGSIIGETYEDELLNQLFSQFCVGK